MNSLYDEIRLQLHGIWRRRWVALSVAWGVCVVGWLIISLIPNRYESHARVLVQLQSLLPDKVGMSDADRQRDIDRVRQTLTSGINLTRIVRETELGAHAASNREVANIAAGLTEKVTVKTTQDNLFEISAVMSGGGRSDRQNAKLAQSVVGKVIDLFVGENIAGDRAETSQTLTFLDNEIARRQAGLQEAEQRKSEFEQKYLGLLPGVGSIADRVQAAQSELTQIDSNLMAAQGSLAAVNGQMASTPSTIAGQGASTIGGNRGRIAALQGQLADAYARGWTDQHPDVVAIKSQIASIQPLASREGGGEVGGTANPLYVTLRSMQAEKQATVAAMQARKAQLQAEMGQLTAKQAGQPGIAAEQAQLSRDYDVLKAQYDKLLTDREEIRLRGDVSSKTDAVKFRVIDAPSLPKLPASPNRLALLAGVLILGIAAGIGSAFALGQVKGGYVTTDGLARASGMPVLGGISEILTSAQLAERQRRGRLFSGAVGGLVGCCALLILIELVQRSLVA